MNYDKLVLNGIVAQLQNLVYMPDPDDPNKSLHKGSISAPLVHDYETPLLLIEKRPLFSRDLQGRDTIPAAFVSIADVQTTRSGSGDLGTITVYTDYVIEIILHHGYGAPDTPLTEQFTGLKTDFYTILNLDTMIQAEGITGSRINIKDGTAIVRMSQRDNKGKPLQQIMTHFRVIYDQPYDQIGEFI